MAHIAFVLVGLVSTFLTGTQAWRARRGAGSPASASVARYFRPGVNWPGRSLYAVFVLGVLLVLMSRRFYGFDDPFVEIGLVIWIVCIGLAEMVIWPGERQLQRVLSEPESGPDRARDIPDLNGLGIRVAVTAWIVCAALIVAIVLMVSKP